MQWNPVEHCPFYCQHIYRSAFFANGLEKADPVSAVVPVTVLKNGLRIATLVLLGNYVDQRILQGDLHRSGGIPFLVVALGFLEPILWVLRKSEKRVDNRV